MRARRALGSALALALAAAPLRAQAGDATSGRFWLATAGVLAVSAALDAPIRRAVDANRTDFMSDLAPSLDPLGRARYILPTLGIAVVAPRVIGRRDLSNAALRVAAGYVAADAVESALKPLVGRHRPSDGRGPWRFHPLARTEEWHSFPSAHTAHSFAIATGLAIESGNHWVATAAYGTAGLVALQRIYTNAHWTSDVTTSAALSIAASGGTVHWLRTRMHAAERPVTARSRLSGPTLTLGTRSVALSLPF